MPDFESELKSRAIDLGFCLVGIAKAGPADGFDRYLRWLDDNYQGEMVYLRNKAEARRNPNALLKNVRSVLMLGLPDTAPAYPDVPSTESVSPTVAPAFGGKIARFAQGSDYHQSIWRRLDVIQEWLQARRPGCRTRGVADTAPLLERDFARRAGLGWIAKNTMLINKRHGSYVLLGAVLTDIELRPDTPHVGMHCGTCTACLDACPTAAFPKPGVLDARKCISYLNIEVKGPLPAQHRREIGDWIYGCDICQDVCPWNRKASEINVPVDASEILTLSDSEFRQRYRGTAIFRIHRQGLARNAAIVLGNVGNESALPHLRKAAEDVDAGVRDAASWAICEIENRLASNVDHSALTGRKGEGVEHS